MILRGDLLRIISQLLALALLCVATVSANGADSPPDNIRVETVDIGLDGSYKVGRWTPVVVTLATDKPVQGRLVLTTVDDEGLSTRYVDPEGQPTSLKTGTTKLERYLRFGNTRPRLTVEFLAEGGDSTRREFRASELPVAKASTSEFIVVVGNDLGVAAALPLRDYRHKRDTHIVTLKSVADLPANPLGFDAVDLLSLSTSEVDKVTTLPKWKSLSDWVLVGGRAVISCGQQGELLFGNEGPLKAIAPGTFDRVASLRRTAALEAYAGSAQRLDGQTTIDLVQFTQVRGRVEASENSGGEQPLVIHYPAGFGQVSLTTFDLDREPFVDWPGRTKLLARVLGFHQPGETGKGQGDRQGAPQAQLGYHDLAGQLRTALDQFGNVRLVAFSWVAGLIALFIFLVGPGDYFFVRFGLKRMQATWLTLGIITVGFIALAWWMDTRLKAREVVVNQAEIVDMDAETGLARGSNWMHIYSPRTAAYSIEPKVAMFASDQSATSPLSAPQTAIAWQGLPGEGLGGLDGRSPPVLFDSPYDIHVPPGVATGAAIHGVPVQTASTKSFVTQWWRAEKRDTKITFLGTDDGLLTGSFDFPWDFELDDAVIYYDRFLYRIPGVVKQGRTIELTPTSTPRDMRFHLTQKRVVDSKEIVTPWNPRHTDLARILEVMMLHEATGGDHYTSLTQRYDLRIDLSDHLATGRAILVGRARKSPTSWGNQQLDSAVDQSTTMVRIVLPVTPAPAR